MHFSKSRFARFVDDLHKRGLIAIPGLHPGIGGVIKIGEELIVFPLRNGVILMVMALATFYRKPHPDIRRGLHPVRDILHPQFLRKGTPLITSGVIAVEAGCDFLGDSGLR